jgi:hypothetical protein
VMSKEELQAIIPPPPPAPQPDHCPAAPPHQRWETTAGGTMRRQVLRPIGEVLGDGGVPEGVRQGLLKHLAECPKAPEQALLAHLNDWQDAEGPD